MDVTNVFKACVKTAKTRNRVLGLNVSSDVNKPTTNNSDILKKASKGRDEFTRKAKEIVSSISKLKDFLLEHRKAYISDADYLSWNASEMDDNDRNQIDMNAQIVMRTCAQILREFKQEVSKQHVKTQEKEHHDGVFHMIDSYLKEVCDTYGEQRAIRVKRAVDKQRLFRLEPETKRMKKSVDQVPFASIPMTTSSDEVATPLAAAVTDVASAADTQYPFGEESNGPSAEEIQMFELENERMYNELSTLGDEVRQIEGQVVEISKLQEVFTSKILQQEHDLDRIADAVVGTTENIKDANEEIREAMKKNASFRVWILFFLIVMAFSLLFLDWYNP